MPEDELNCRNCQKLKLYKDCPGKPTNWYSYEDIWFCQHQMIWLIANIEYLTRGSWPPSPFTSGEIDMAVSQRRMPNEAYFIKPSTVLAELMWRLRRTGKDGETLMDEILKAGIGSRELLSRHAQSALDYITGWHRKETPYSVWKAQRKYKGIVK